MTAETAFCAAEEASAGLCDRLTMRFGGFLFYPHRERKNMVVRVESPSRENAPLSNPASFAVPSPSDDGSTRSIRPF